MSGEIGWYSTMHLWIPYQRVKFHWRIVTWRGLQPLVFFLASENGAFGFCWYWICDVLELLFLQAIFGCSDSSFAAAVVWVCLVVSNVVSSFSTVQISMFGVQALSDNRRRILFLKKGLGDSLPALPSLASRSRQVRCRYCHSCCTELWRAESALCGEARAPPAYFVMLCTQSSTLFAIQLFHPCIRLWSCRDQFLLESLGRQTQP